MSDDLTPHEIETLAPGCIQPHRADDKRALLTQINAHHNKGSVQAPGGQLDEIRLWDHQRDDLYIVIVTYPWFDEHGGGLNYQSDMVATSFGHAVLRGAELTGTSIGDFHIGVIRDNRLVAVLWVDQITEADPIVLAEIADEIGLTE